MNQDVVPRFLEKYFEEDDFRLIQERLEEVKKTSGKTIFLTIMENDRCRPESQAVIAPQKNGWGYEPLKTRKTDILILLVISEKQFTILCKDDELVVYRDLAILEREMDNRFRGGAHLICVLFGIKKIGQYLLLAEKTKNLLDDVEKKMRMKQQALHWCQVLPMYFEAAAEKVKTTKDPDKHYQSLVIVKDLMVTGTRLMEEKNVDWEAVYRSFKDANQLLIDIMLDLLNCHFEP